MSKTSILKKHIEFKKTSVKSKSKIQDIERYLKLFLLSTRKPLDKIKEEDIIKFLNSLNYSIRTINDIKAYLKVFLKWHYPDWSARFRNLDKILKQQKPQRAYEPEQMISFQEFEKLVKTENNLQWKVFWLTLFYGGFRPSEACNLKWKNIFFEPKGVIIKVHSTKTNKDFYKSLPENAEHLLKELKANSTSEYLFPSPFGNKPIVARTVCLKLKRLSKKALGKEVVPYALRHSIATLLYSDDKRKDDDTANQLGHTKSMKQTYMNLNEGQLKEQARKLWGEKFTKKDKDEIQKLREQLKVVHKFSKIVIESIKNPTQKNVNKLNKIAVALER